MWTTNKKFQLVSIRWSRETIVFTHLWTTERWVVIRSEKVLCLPCWP